MEQEGSREENRRAGAVMKGAVAKLINRQAANTLGGDRFGGLVRKRLKRAWQEMSAKDRGRARRALERQQKKGAPPDGQDAG